MLDPWIIEEIKRREDERRREEGKSVVIELPVEESIPSGDGEKGKVDDEVPRGVTVIDFCV